MRLYIVRHADPDYPGGTITPAGHLEARALADRLAKEGIDSIYSSPMGRAMHTAQYTADRLALPINVQPWMEEMGRLQMTAGPCAGQMAWDAHGHVLRDGPPGANGGWHPQTAASFGGDSRLPPAIDEPGFSQEIDRVGRDSDRFLADLGYVRQGGVYRVASPNRRRIAVFCHGGLGLTWLAHLLALPLAAVWSGFWLPPSSVTVVLMDERGEGLATPRCLCLGDTSHLHAAGLPIQPAGIKANFD